MALINGSEVAKRILAQVKDRIGKQDTVPGLAVLLAGDYLESEKYVGLKEARAEEVGIRFEKFLFQKTVTERELCNKIRELNSREDIHGVVVQLPLPDGLDPDKVIAVIDPEKDTDGFHEKTLKRFFAGTDDLCPVFPRAIRELLHETKVSLQGKSAIALVNSDRMGKVLVQALGREGLRAEYVLSSSPQEMLEKTADADVVVTACGIPNVVTAHMVSLDAIVIDGGNVHVDGKVQGDVSRNEVEKKVSFLSPVPGGVGPVTVATLLARVTDAALLSVDK